MKRKKLFALVTPLLYFSCDSSSGLQDKASEKIIPPGCNDLPVVAFDRQEIIHELEKELSDSLIRNYFSEDINRMTGILQSSEKDPSILFPFQQIDSAIYSYYEPYQEEKRALEGPGIRLCAEKQKLLIQLVNNPVLFNIGECGTPIPQARVDFYSEGLPVASIDFSCSHSQLHCTPENPLTRFGHLNEKGNELLDQIAPWE